VVDEQKFFKTLGQRIRELRKKRGYSQEDMISFGFSARHWQQIEAGRPITVRTLLRVCGVFKTRMAQIVRGLDKTKTADREKIALWLDRPSLDTLREIQQDIGVPVSEQIRRAVTAYLQKDSGRPKKPAK